MTKITTTAELDALPVGAKVKDRFSDLGDAVALWVKHPDQRWHLTEQKNTRFQRTGFDWSGPNGDSAEDILSEGPVEVVS